MRVPEADLDASRRYSSSGRNTITHQPPSLDARLRFAIAHKRLVTVVYHGSARVAEPHDYGVQGGIERLFVYQLRALARSGKQGGPGWRLLTLSEIQDCVVLDDTFPGSRGRAHHKHLEWDTVYARVN